MSHEEARALLERHDWDLTSAVNAHFEGQSEHAASSLSPAYPPSRALSSAPSGGSNWITRIIGRILLLPVSLVSSILSIPFTLLRFLRRPNPFLSGPPLSPEAASERWKQSMHLVDAGTVDSTWHTGRYEDVLRLAKEKKRLMMTVLTSEEHQDHEAFKHVIRDGELQDLLTRNDIVCWGGDVRYRDAYVVSSTLQNYAYPCIALASLTSSSPSNMVILSRLEGPTALSSTTIQSTITNVLSRVEPYLSRERASAEQRLMERVRRERDERRLAETAERDAERILRKRQEERERIERAERERKEAERQARARKDRAERRANDERWRVVVRNLIADKHPEPTASTSMTTRIGVRMGDGRRLARRFNRSDPVSLVYAWVESERSMPASTSGTEQVELDDNGIPTKEYAFRLVTPLPRRVVDLSETTTTTLEQAGLVPDANLVFEQGSDDQTDSEDDDDD